MTQTRVKTVEYVRTKYSNSWSNYKPVLDVIDEMIEDNRSLEYCKRNIDDVIAVMTFTGRKP